MYLLILYTMSISSLTAMSNVNNATLVTVLFNVPGQK